MNGSGLSRQRRLALRHSAGTHPELLCFHLRPVDALQGKFHPCLIAVWMPS